MIDLARVKLHLKLDGDEENSLVAGYFEAAKAMSPCTAIVSW